ncbi:MAG: ATP phosphoribosyltransferase [Polyangiaceae bacterium]|nr:ATP phosphoribosyltransferase [Polyangiaceae bacterium]
MIKIALPNKGRLADNVRAVLEDAGLGVRIESERALTASIGEGFTALFVRAQDIPEFVADGAAHAGVTGWDCVAESGREVDTLLDLGFGRCRLVVAVPSREGATLDSLPAHARVATSFPRVAARFFEARGKPVHIVPINGAAEVTPHLGVADAIVDLVSTGSTLRVNGLQEVATVVESSARLICAPRASLDPSIAGRLDDLAFALSSVIRARDQRYLMANVPRASLEAVRTLLPGLRGPTVVDVLGTDFVAVHSVVPQKSVFKTTLALKALGCEGILVTRIERLVP